MRLVTAALLFALPLTAQAPIRWLDLAADERRQVTVARDARQYLGHPTTVRLPGTDTVLCVYPRGHGKGAIELRRSDDGGMTWSAPMPVPESWQTSKETPTIHRLIDARDGTARLVLFSGMHPIRSAVSGDDGATWSELQPIGDFGGIVAMASVVQLTDGDYAAFFHDDGRFFRVDGQRSQFTVYQTRSSDGGLSWREPTVVWSGDDMDLCEPGVLRSPDGATLLMLLRENRRVAESQLMLSHDEGVTWTPPRALPRTLTGDRHVGVYALDGRLVLSFRDVAKGSPTRGDWVAWVGSYDDLLHGRDGQYRVRLSRNWHAWDCAYPGVERLDDGSILTTTYGHWAPGAPPFVRAMRFSLDELDELAQTGGTFLTREPKTVHPTPRGEDWWPPRVAEDLSLAKQGGHRLVMLGDSITQSWSGGGKEAWAEYWAPRHALNVGVSGDRTQHALWRLDHGLLEALAAADNDVRCVVVMIGTNNSNGADCTAEEIAAGIEAIVRRLRVGLPRANVLLLSIFPRGDKPSAQRQKNARASELAAAAFASDDMVVSRDIGSHFLAADGTLSKHVMPDLLHLSKAAYRTWAEAIVADVDAMLQR